MKRILTLVILLLVNVFTTTATSEDSSSNVLDALKAIIEKDKAIKYQTGNVDLNSDISLNIPAGYKLMSKEDAEYVVFDFWGNPRQEGILGMIVRENYSLMDTSNWAFVMTYENSGYVKDEDADKIDYKEMMDQIHESEKEENEQRVKDGYPTVHIIDWATKPFYDKQNNILHWAKSIKFGSNTEDTTLNYDVRILGRRGVLSLNAVGVLQQLEDIQQHIPQIIHIAKFKKGSSYLDFDPSVDKVAAYTIGGLVAGKILAKAGLIALLLKNIKLVLLGIAALFGGFGKKIIGFFTRKKEEPYIIEEQTAAIPAENPKETEL